MKDFILAALLFILMIAFATVAFAQGAFPCMNYDEFREMLYKQYREEMHWQGATSENLIQLFLAETGSFTIVLVLKDGRSCMIGAGKKSTHMPPKIRGVPS